METILSETKSLTYTFLKEEVEAALCYFYDIKFDNDDYKIELHLCEDGYVQMIIKYKTKIVKVIDDSC